VSVLGAREAAPLHLAQIADRLRQVTVEIDGPNGGGAGVLWAPDLVVTNAHVAVAPIVRVGLADDRHVALGFEQIADAAAHDLVVVEQEHGDRVAHCVIFALVTPTTRSREP